MCDDALSKKKIRPFLLNSAGGAVEFAQSVSSLDVLLRRNRLTWIPEALRIKPVVAVILPSIGAVLLFMLSIATRTSESKIPDVFH
ncbi:unnamed protein product [Angiostrongylus costaricensis]|uniref:Uncharacterized protein n=1 Tax=Angiostrongylus costaricensis TaxID=334426 RepID=A0A0R3PRP2_ANGCS|nr:unnamed protein product [Angiostrongylus costaricensis]